jgi:hypothetical protein
MSEQKNKILKVALPVELYEQLEKAAAADDRELDRFVVRMIRQYLEALAGKAPVSGPLVFQSVIPAGTSIPSPRVDAGPVALGPDKTAEQLFDEAKGRAAAFAMKPGMPGTPALIESDPLSGQTVEPVVRAKPLRPAPAGQENLFPSHK